MEIIMKRPIALLLALSLLSVLSLLLSACQSECVHTWDEGVVRVAPSCMEVGMKRKSCTQCGEMKTEVLAATGHSFSDEWSYDRTHHWYAATCAHVDEVIEREAHDFSSGACICGAGEGILFVDESKWDTLFTGTYLNHCTIHVTQTSGNIHGEVFWRITPEAIYKHIVSGAKSRTGYFIHKNDKWYEIYKNNGVWVGQERDISRIEDYRLQETLVYFIGAYDDFFYDEAEKCYVATSFSLSAENPSERADIVKIYVKDSRLIELQVTMNGIHTVYTLSRFGTTVVDDVPSFSYQ